MRKPVKKRSVVMRRIEEALREHFEVDSPIGCVFTLDTQISETITVEDFRQFGLEDMEEVLSIINDALNGRTL